MPDLRFRRSFWGSCHVFRATDDDLRKLMCEMAGPGEEFEAFKRRTREQLTRWLAIPAGDGKFAAFDRSMRVLKGTDGDDGFPAPSFTMRCARCATPTAR
ncbi:MAG: hypothetical protein AB7H71_04080 [Alphaproteobacteria bacterium]